MHKSKELLELVEAGLEIRLRIDESFPSPAQLLTATFSVLEEKATEAVYKMEEERHWQT